MRVRLCLPRFFTPGLLFTSSNSLLTFSPTVFFSALRRFFLTAPQAMFSDFRPVIELGQLVQNPFSDGCLGWSSPIQIIFTAVHFKIASFLF
ncbi:hypothetical protein E1A91_D13G113200v1 [Gossypium mustelinum]|uniref:Uncharacterized protein n=1 Tax=Gossypium mustelinum TaxID=34275 RepID=A0A5D2S4F5_GOSMU|nr:hypothetical protein E1A91_D13G113200v1 [Gossypium mustelinum]